MAEERQPKPNENQPLIDAIETELGSIDEATFPNLHALAIKELYRLRGGIADWLDVVTNRKCKVRTKIAIPVDEYPGYNFVGKLLGPGGATLKQIQEQTMTKMAILGQGSVRNEEKEREMLNSGDPKYKHLKEKLHLQIDSLAPPSEAYYRLSHALAEVKKLMTPEDDQYYQNSMGQPGMMGRGGRGGRGGPRGGIRGGRGGPPTGRGASQVGNGMDMYGAPPVPGYDQSMVYDANAAGFEQYGQPAAYEGSFGTGYAQGDSWGKTRGGGGGRGQGNRSFPYSRGGKPAANGARGGF